MRILKLKRKYISNEDGFTIIEVVVTIIILGILSLFGYGIVALNARTFSTVQQNTVARWDLRTAMRIVKNDLKMIDPQYISGSLAADQIEFTGGDGHVYRYNVNSGNLQRKVDSGSWSTILSHVTSDPFAYEDQNQNTTNNKNDLVYIVIHLVTTTNGRTTTLTEKIYVRN